LPFPNGCHIVEVEIDPNTGVVTIERTALRRQFPHKLLRGNESI
jgi:hypothetical protein